MDTEVFKGLLKTKFTTKKCSKHHLFTRDEVIFSLVRIVGFPESNLEKIMFYSLVDHLHGCIPKLRIPDDLHKKIHEIENNEADAEITK